MRILIANRGEIARRIQRTAHRLGHQTVAVWADPDRDAPFVAEASASVRLGPADLAASYLSVDAILAAATSSRADAVHPGYGFLAENDAFARAVQDAGLTWIGPHPEAMRVMGSKIQARRLAADAGVPTIPGFDADQDPAALAEAADRIGYPVLVKASAGGGGKGIRIAHAPDEFDAALTEASEEARRAFGDGAMIVERFVQRPRHVEVQVVGDRHATVIELGTRECSLQRRYQKIIEEAPAPNLPTATRAGLREAAVRLAKSMDYDSAGTVEFIVDDDTGDFFFLEMNTRLQVEHPVTELVTGLDLVELQLLVASGASLPLTQDEVVLSGHAFEARINAEDPWAGFVPQTGTVTAVEVPHGLRWDAAIQPCSVIGPHYDPMIAKAIAGGCDRDEARRRLVAGLEQLLLAGVTTNTGFLRWLLTQPAVVDGHVTTRFLDDNDLPGAPDLAPVAELAARVWQEHRDRATTGSQDPWSAARRFRLTPHRPAPVIVLTRGSETWEVTLPGRGPDSHVDRDADADARQGSGPGPGAGAPRTTVGPVAVDLAARTVAVTVDAATWSFDVPRRQDRWSGNEQAGGPGAGELASPFPAMVTEVHVTPGDDVEAGATLVVIEAMKMLHSLTAVGAGTIAEVRVTPGTQVDSGAVLVTFATADTDSADSDRKEG